LPAKILDELRSFKSYSSSTELFNFIAIFEIVSPLIILYFFITLSLKITSILEYKISILFIGMLMSYDSLGGVIFFWSEGFILFT